MLNHGRIGNSQKYLWSSYHNLFNFQTGNFAGFTP
jgi:hypothetical protein